MFDTLNMSQEALEGIRTASEGAAPLDMANLLKKLLKFGFVSCRYYDVALNVPSPGSVLILTTTVGDTPNKLGYKIPYGDSTLAQGSNPRRATVGSSKSAGSVRFVEDLGLHERDWVDVPVWHRDRLIGLIAADWKASDIPALTSQDVLLLEFISLRISSSMFTQPVPDSITQLESAATIAGHEEHLLSLMQDATREICKTLSAASVAVFEHHWQSNSLVKIAEEVHIDCRSRHSDFPEIYSPSKPSLTWHAWENDSVRNVADFEEFRRLHPDSIDIACVNRHETLLGGPVVSMLYSIVGVRERRYLIRVMNRVDAPQLPFVTRHAELLEIISTRMSVIVDHETANARFHRLEKTARALCGRTGAQTSDILQISLESFEAEGIRNYAVFTRAKSGTHKFSSVQRAGPRLKQWNVSEQLLASTENDRFFAKCFQLEQPKILDVRSFTEHTDSDHFLGFLSSRGVEWLVVCPFTGSDICGLVACPIVIEPITGEVARTRVSPSLGAPRQRILATYSAMLGSALESIQSSHTGEHARNLIGHIGHEVNTPVLMIGQQAYYVIAMSQQLAGANPDVLRELTSAQLKIEEQMRSLEKTMSTATLVGQTAKKRLELELRHHDVMELLKAAQARVRNQLDVILPDKTRVRATIQISDSCSRMGRIVCDWDHMLTVLQNVFGNAIKYSLPVHGQRNEPMRISVKGMFQRDLVIFQVTNHGRGIAPEDREAIFLPFVRGTLRTQTRITRGMGLGLYISRRIAVAHGGELFCQSSEFASSNPSLKEKWEGFNTTFEIRISRNLREGLTDFSWDEES